jgi:hypothetical protein
MDSFTPVPNEWFEHLSDGRLTMPMFTILIYLKRACIWKTGVWRGNADKIAYNLNHELEKRQISRYLRRLHACGYITSHAVQGQRRPYKIDLNNYVAHHDNEDFLIRPTELKDWQDLPPDDDAVDDDEATVTRRRHDAVDNDEVTNSTLDVPDLPDELDELDGLDEPNEGKKEGRKEDAPVADAPSATVGDEPTSDQGTYLWRFLNEDAIATGAQAAKDAYRRGSMEDIYEVIWLWNELTGVMAMNPTVYEAVAQASSECGYDTITEYMPKIVREFPRTAKVPWKDLTFFLAKFEMNKRQVDGWRRGLEARQQTKPSNGNGHAPLWVSKKLDDGTMLRTLGRKPRTAAERAELLELLQQPKINREYILGFLVQDNCPDCGGQDINCQRCVITLEVMPDPPIAPAPQAACNPDHVSEDGNKCLDCGSVKGAQHFRKGI